MKDSFSFSFDLLGIGGKTLGVGKKSLILNYLSYKVKNKLVVPYKIFCLYHFVTC